MGADVVFAKNQIAPPQTLAYKLARKLFLSAYRLFVGLDLEREAPSYRILNRKVITWILRHPRSAIMYRQLPATAGFVRVNLAYKKSLTHLPKKRLGKSFERGMQMLVWSTRAPMRCVTGLSLFGAYSNLLYSAYVVCIALFKEEVAPGWVSMSLQQSGMFFLVSLVLLVLGEYLLSIVGLLGEGPGYRIVQEFTSNKMSRYDQLNITSQNHANGTPETANSEQTTENI